MVAATELSFLDVFGGLEAPRSSRNRLYTMSELLLTCLCAAVCGADGWQDVEDFGNAKINYLRTILPFSNGIPSDDTFRRFFRALDPSAFQELFIEWVRQLQPTLQSDVIAIDGKSSRHSFDGESSMLHMVSAFATEARLVLGQEKVSQKSNEITAIPKLIEALDIRGSTITIDAMGCQHAIAEKICSKEGDYILALKGNQGALCDDVKTHLQDAEIIEKLAPHTEWDKGHGRLESRTCCVSFDVDWLIERHQKWRSMGCLIRLESLREIKGKKSIETRYYIGSNKDLTAQKALNQIRSNWAIENSLHWVLDMSFGDDMSRIRKENAPQIMAIIRHIALNMLQTAKNNMKRQSIKRLRKVAGWNDDSLTSIISQKFS